MKIKTWLVLSLLSVSLAATGQTSDVRTKRDDILRLLQITGAAKGGTQVLDMVLPSLKKSMPQVPEPLWQEFRSEVREDEIVQMTYEIWDKHFTHQEIRDLIRFYQSPTGQKIIRETPAIQQESLAVGQKWGNQIVDRILVRLREKGFQIPPDLE